MLPGKDCLDVVTDAQHILLPAYQDGMLCRVALVEVLLSCQPRSPGRSCCLLTSEAGCEQYDLDVPGLVTSALGLSDDTSPKQST